MNLPTLHKQIRKALQGWWLVIFLLLASCANNPSGDRDTGQHVAGAAIGGGVAVAGTAALRAPAPLVVTAGVGGMALGYYATTVRFDAGPIYKSGGEVYRQGDYIGISIPSYKLFDTNTAELLPQATPLLDSVVAVLKRYPDSNILVSGNTNGIGFHGADQRLSQARARVVASYLWAHGINNFKAQSLSTRKLTFVGYGDYFPIASDLKPRNIQKNSRIQITAYPSKADLQLDKTSQAFENVGGYSDPVVDL